MKKKLALLLASVMTLSALPMNLFALSNNSVSGLASYVPKKTLLFENGMFNSSYAQAVSGNDDVAYAVDGTDLVITLNDTIYSGSQFRVKLDNAKWFFKNVNGVTNSDWSTYFINSSVLTSSTENATSGSSIVGVDPTVPSTQWSSEVAAILEKPNGDPTTVIGNIRETLKELGATSVSEATINNIYNAMPKTTQVITNDDQLFGNESLAQSSQANKVKAGLAFYVDKSGRYGFYHQKPKNNAGSMFTVADAIQNYTKLYPTSNYRYGSGGYSSITGKDVTYNLDRGIFSSLNNNSGLGTYYRYPLNAELDASGKGIMNTRREVPYKMTISDGSGESEGIVEILPLLDASGNTKQNVYKRSYESGVSMYEIRIPLVVRTTEEQDIKVSVIDTSNLTAISYGTYILGTSSGSGTTTTLRDPESTRDTIDLGTIMIRENRVNSIAVGGVIELKAPTGYTFSDPLATKDGKYTTIFGVESDLKWAKQTQVAGINNNPSRDSEVGAGVLGRDYFIGYRRINNNSYINLDTTLANLLNLGSNYYLDKSTIYIYVPASDGTTRGLVKSTLGIGSLYVKGLTLIADEGAPFGTVPNMEIRTLTSDNIDYYNVYNSVVGSKADATTADPWTSINRYDFGISTQSVATLARNDWTLAMTTITAVPELIAGRYSTATAYGADDTHKAAKVQIKENAVSAWWAGRETKISLPDGVKFRRIRITKADEIAQSDALKKDFAADGTKNQYITVNSGDINFYNLTINKDKKAVVEFESWLSVRADYTGDITLVLDNNTSSTVTNTSQVSCVIAKAIAPVTIATEVTEIKIGYQTYPVADVTITETAPGRLQKGKQLLVSVSDLITQDLYFAPINPSTDLVYANTDSDLQVNNVTTVNTDSVGNRFGATSSLMLGGGTISMDISRASSVKAGAITLKNLNVKVDRAVPQSTIKYNVIAWGTAVAENYGTNKDQFTTPGIMTEFVSVISSANDKASVLTQEVRLTIGDNYYLVGGKPVDMDAKAYLSESGSTMVPIRFVSNALGISDDQIHYDDATKTVTILHPSRVIQFTAGSNKMMLNGAPITMDHGATSEITNERLYIPFRAIGNAFGLEVDWDAATQTAIYRQP